MRLDQTIRGEQIIQQKAYLEKNIKISNHSNL